MKDKIDKVYGFHALNTLLEYTPYNVLSLMVVKGREDARLETLLAQAKKQGIAIEWMSAEALSALVQSPHHQGVGAHCKLPQARSEDALYSALSEPEKIPLLLILDSVQDPHNLGACLRSAAAFGVDAVVVPRNNSVGLNATVCKVACGAAHIIPFYQVVNLKRALKQLQKKGVWLIGTEMNAQKTVSSQDLTLPSAFVLGNEGQGLRRLTAMSCDTLVSIPMQGAMASLNVSVASAICLYEAQRQRSH